MQKLSAVAFKAMPRDAVNTLEQNNDVFKMYKPHVYDLITRTFHKSNEAIVRYIKVKFGKMQKICTLYRCGRSKVVRRNLNGKTPNLKSRHCNLYVVKV